ncbi:hypothetical protein BCEN4_370150 [Burkholderia cenocepacia]|nr:hypothetical protein BCEN4_370150 [Burkholderia cenocepacia]
MFDWRKEFSRDSVGVMLGVSIFRLSPKRIRDRATPMRWVCFIFAIESLPRSCGSGGGCDCRGGGEREDLMLLGRAVLFLSGWEVAVVTTAIQVLIWYFCDNDLQTWFEKCYFGRSQNSPLWPAGNSTKNSRRH